MKFLEYQAKSLGLPVKVIEVKPNKPIVIITWVGTEPNLPSILLNSHTDVVPVFEVTVWKMSILTTQAHVCNFPGRVEAQTVWG